MGIDHGKIAALVAALDSHDKPSIRSAVDALIALAFKHPELRETLDRRLLDARFARSWPAAYILGHFSPISAACLDTLLQTLDHPDPDIRWAMALLLVKRATSDNAVIERLIRLAAAGTANQKRMALYCLRDLELSDPESLAAMSGALGDADPTVRVAAAICLKERSDAGEVAGNKLLKVYLEDRDARVRHAAAITLACLEPVSPAFLAALGQARNSADAQTKKAAEAALAIVQKRRPASSGG